MLVDMLAPEHRAHAAQDALSEVLHAGAEKLLAEAVKAEATAFLTENQEELDESGFRRLVLNGYIPEREIQTGLGALRLKMPRVRDRRAEGGENLQFRSQLVRPYARRLGGFSDLFPWLYLQGLLTGDFSEALAMLVGMNASDLPGPMLSLLGEIWRKERAIWRRRDLTNQRYAAVWANAVDAQNRFADDKLCLMVLIGATQDRRKEVIAVRDGYRESEAPWLLLLRRLEARGLRIDPEIAIAGPDAAGFRDALSQVWRNTSLHPFWHVRSGSS